MGVSEASVLKWQERCQAYPWQEPVVAKVPGRTHNEIFTRTETTESLDDSNRIGIRIHRDVRTLKTAEARDPGNASYFRIKGVKSR